MQPTLSGEYLLSKIEMASRRIMGDDPAHGWPHVVRVMHNAELIVYNEGVEVDWVVLRVSIYLHDTGRFISGEGHHVAKSVSYATNLLEKLGVPKDFIRAVTHAIEAHSYSYGVRPSTIEAMVLSDADKLDALGAIGIARVFHHGCLNNRSFEDSVSHMVEKLLELPSKMILGYSRRLAEERVSIIRAFIEQYRREIMQ